MNRINLHIKYSSWKKNGMSCFTEFIHHRSNIKTPPTFTFAPTFGARWTCWTFGGPQVSMLAVCTIFVSHGLP